MLGRRCRRWANIGPTLGQCVVFAGQAFRYTKHVAINKNVILYCFPMLSFAIRRLYEVLSIIHYTAYRLLSDNKTRYKHS